MGQRARGTCCLPFRFGNRVNGEWAEGKEVLIRSRTLEQCGRPGWGMGRCSELHTLPLGDGEESPLTGGPLLQWEVLISLFQESSGI